MIAWYTVRPQTRLGKGSFTKPFKTDLENAIAYANRYEDALKPRYTYVVTELWQWDPIGRWVRIG